MQTSVNDKRVLSKEGFLLADAVLARTGALPYLRGELGLEGDPNGIVKIDRSREVLEKALPTMIGAPITIDHPASMIGSGDADEHVVGSVASIPTISDDGLVKAKIRVFSKDAIDMIQSGKDELSPGYNFVMRDLDDNKGTAHVAEMSINHVAIVPKGRAGHSVRVLDSLPPILYNDNAKESNKMDDKQLNDIIAKAVDAAMRTRSTNDDTNMSAVKDTFVSAITDSLKPMLDSIQAVKDNQDKAIKEAKDAEAKAALDKEKDDLVKSVIDAERAKFAVLEDAKQFIAADKHDGLMDMEVQGILALAVGDSVKDAKDKSLDYLRGIFDAKVEASKTGVEVGDATPAGVVQAGNEGNPKSLQDAYRKRFEGRNKQMTKEGK